MQHALNITFFTKFYCNFFGPVFTSVNLHKSNSFELYNLLKSLF